MQFFTEFEHVCFSRFRDSLTMAMFTDYENFINFISSGYFFFGGLFLAGADGFGARSGVGFIG